MTKKTFLFAGPRRHHHDDGGVTILFEQLIDSISMKNNILVDTNVKNYANPMAMLLVFIAACFKAVFKGAEVSLHGTARDYQYLGLIILFFHKAFGVSYHCRKFAGNFDVLFEKMPLFWRKVVSRFLKYSSANFFETIYLVNYFKKYNKSTYFLPNYRAAVNCRTNNKFKGKFVFLGHIKKEKGIQHIIDCENLLREDWRIDLYGTLVDYTENDFKGRIDYKGILSPNAVIETLVDYSALLLPSHREGYPGVVIEALSVGLPVIVSDLMSTREMIDRSCGILTAVGDSESIVAGMFEVEKNYEQMRDGAMKRFSMYDKDNIIHGYFKTIQLGL
jgi:glycosyltransferase involved in cell wall biosynthesis